MSFDSFSSSLLSATAMYRNQPGTINKFVAECGYGVIAIVSVIETLAAAAFTLIALAAYPVAPRLLDESVKWLDSSSFCILWSIVSILFNPFEPCLVDQEAPARAIIYSYIPSF